MIDFLWLLLPLAAASGWLAARRKERQQASVDDFKGLNHQLNDEPDKLIDIVINQKLDNETLLELGIFFRRKGEINRAIRIHKNLLKHSTAPALFELAQDYRYAGLLDRAEKLFQKLSRFNSHKTLALRQLQALYQQEHDWKKAIRTAQQIAEPTHTEIAQYYCEQAEEYQQERESEAAQQAIQKALKTDPNCARASLLKGQLALERGETKQAILAFQRVEQQDPDYISEIITPLQTCYQGQEFTHYLRHLLEHHASIKSMLALANIIKQQEGDSQLFDFIVEKIQNSPPSLHGLDLLLDLALSKKDSISRDYLLLLKEISTQLLKNEPAYKCTHCGLTTRKLYWQCPSCHEWNTVKPL
ncbi:hypothetical protein PN36_31885 [Candidatus Thiomargarita nelsonii]|uniref:LapB rubredoxin metal binding domain-containing protein n=1 Tax=Candidatus Thiomargarita nelsonii TaxID=1003181 RepID=A0A0A6PD13_9GAMM|nr:hypothetical protein PN36_31885 [Candidatus Thiomargarita nelsonii]